VGVGRYFMECGRATEACSVRSTLGDSTRLFCWGFALGNSNSNLLPFAARTGHDQNEKETLRKGTADGAHAELSKRTGERSQANYPFPIWTQTKGRCYPILHRGLRPIFSGEFGGLRGGSIGLSRKVGGGFSNTFFGGE